MTFFTCLAAQNNQSKSNLQKMQKKEVLQIDLQNFRYNKIQIMIKNEKELSRKDLFLLSSFYIPNYCVFAKDFLPNLVVICNL